MRFPDGHTGDQLRPGQRARRCRRAHREIHQVGPGQIENAAKRRNEQHGRQRGQRPYDDVRHEAGRCDHRRCEVLRAESPYVAHRCSELGLNAAVGECILMFAAPHGIHKAHRVLAGMLGRLPA